MHSAKIAFKVVFQQGSFEIFSPERSKEKNKLTKWFCQANGDNFSRLLDCKKEKTVYR